MARVTATDRLRRVLAVVPWIVANPGCKVADAAKRFSMTEDELLSDLSIVYMVGLPPYSPDALIDVCIDETGAVTIELADYFSRPLRLSPAQGFALLASAEALRSTQGLEPVPALETGLEKLQQSLGVDNTVAVHLGDAEAVTLKQLRDAIAKSVEVEFRYYSFGRDETTTRTVSPWRVFAEAGAWYLLGWCSSAQGERVFRIDRIETMTKLDSTGRRADYDVTQAAMQHFSPSESDPRVVLHVDSTHSWVYEVYPYEKVICLDDGSFEVTLAISETGWLERLLVCCGPAVKVVSAPDLQEAKELGASASSRVLARYNG